MMKYLKIFENTEPEKDIEYYDNGNIQSIEYTLDDYYHREDGPAFQSWYENGQIIGKLYYIKGNLHREDGPAYQKWDENGQISKYYYLNDIKYDREKWLNKLKKINSPHYKEQKDLYDMEQNIEKYNL